MSKIINDVASEYDIPTKSTIIINNDYDNSIKREDKPFIWISEEIFTLKRDKDKLQQENKQLKEELKYTVPIVEHNKIVSEKSKENKQLKEVIEEARELIPKQLLSNVNITKYTDEMCLRDILQILDKVKN